METQKEIKYSLDDLDELHKILMKFIEHDLILKVNYLKLDENCGNLKTFTAKITNDALNDVFDTPEILCVVDSWNIDIYFKCKNEFYEHGHDSGMYISNGRYILLRRYHRKKK